MKIQKNMANIIRAFKEASGKSLYEFSAELEISRSALQDYLSGKGNPNVATLEHLAKKLGIDTSFLISDAFSHNQIEILIKLLEMQKFLSGISAKQRRRFAELVWELVLIWDRSDYDASA